MAHDLSTSEKIIHCWQPRPESPDWREIPGSASPLARHHIAVNPRQKVLCQRHLGVDKERIIGLLSMLSICRPVNAIHDTGIDEAYGHRPIVVCTLFVMITCST